MLTRSQSITDGRENTLGLLQHLVVPEAEDCVAFALQPGSSPRVSFSSVLPTVDFDDELPVEADEIDDVRTDRVLPPDLCADGHTVSQMLPE